MTEVGSIPTVGTEKEYYTWEQFDTDVKEILVVISPGFYDSIYAIPRGGLPLGVRLSHELDIPLILGGATKKTLVVDEICDTGRALQPYIGRCHVLTLYKYVKCPMEPTYWFRENTNWVHFPWEKQE